MSVAGHVFVLPLLGLHLSESKHVFLVIAPEIPASAQLFLDVEPKLLESEIRASAQLVLKVEPKTLGSEVPEYMFMELSLTFLASGHLSAGFKLSTDLDTVVVTDVVVNGI